jgi:hypothetical protein
MPEQNEFLNPKSMITPGIAGGLTMLITNALGSQFDLPGSWTSLTLSFLFGLLVFGATAIPLIQRLVFYVINSLIIFSVAVGANSAGHEIRKSAPKAVSLPAGRYAHPTTLNLLAYPSKATFFKSWFPKEDDIRVQVVPSRGKSEGQL